MRDQLNAQRLALPWVKVTADYVFDTPTGKVKLDKNRQAIADNYLTEVAKGSDGKLYNKVIKVVPAVNQTMGDRSPRTTKDSNLTTGEKNGYPKTSSPAQVEQIIGCQTLS